MNEYTKAFGAGAIPNYMVAPFLELYAEGIINSNQINILTSVNPYFPDVSKAYGKNIGIQFVYSDSPVSEDDLLAKDIHRYGSMKEMVQYVSTDVYIGKYNKASGMKAKTLQQVDAKLDDGNSLTGRARAMCADLFSGKTHQYEEAANNGEDCVVFVYAI